MKASTASTSALFTDVGKLIKSRLQRSLPLPFSQCQTLWFVEGKGRPNMQDIARYFNITAPSATFLVDELVRGKYLARQTNDEDRRKVELTLTSKGKQALASATEKRAHVLNGIFKSVSEDDRSELNRILHKIISNV